MPSFSHDFLVELFRGRGELAPALLEICANIKLAHERVEHGSIDLSQVTSTEYRADSVVMLRGRGDTVVGALIVEVQLRIDHDKPRAWPVYVAALRAKHGCPVVLLVIAPDRKVARWARRPIELGHPGFCLEPVVISLRDVPRIVDRGLAARVPELAVLAALAHPDLEVATTAIGAISTLPGERGGLYLDVILSALPGRLRTIMEARMQGYVYQSEFARKYYAQGLEKGLEQGVERGVEQGVEQGVATGRVQGLRTAVRTLVRVRLEELTADEEEVIAAICTDEVATALIGALARATSAAEVRAALAAAR